MVLVSRRFANQVVSVADDDLGQLLVHRRQGVDRVSPPAFSGGQRVDKRHGIDYAEPAQVVRKGKAPEVCSDVSQSLVDDCEEIRSASVGQVSRVLAAPVLREAGEWGDDDDDGAGSINIF